MPITEKSTAQYRKILFFRGGKVDLYYIMWVFFFYKNLNGQKQKTNTVRFVNRKNHKAVLQKELTLYGKLDNEKLGFQSDVRIFVSENLTPYNQHLAWKYRELKRAGKIRSYWSAKDVVKIKGRLNERPIVIISNTDMAYFG